MTIPQGIPMGKYKMKNYYIKEYENVWEREGEKIMP